MAAEDDDVVIALKGVGKCYSLEHRPLLRLWRDLWGQQEKGPVHHALHDVNLQVRRGEAVGLIGRNGAGKSTLLQIICGVLQASAGQRQVKGRIAALLELGAGFNPDLTGRENVRLNGPLLGLAAAEVEHRLPEIIEFAGIGDYIDQPVRSYSSGMFVRLAFSMATSVEPDILIIDEALSVGDGVFARKSFERIMALKARGATILLCSHSLFQIESLCQRAIWLHDGRVQFDGPAHQASVEYGAWQGEAGAPDDARPSAPKVRADTAAAALREVRLARISGDGYQPLPPGVARAEPPASSLPTEGPVLRSGLDTLQIEVHAQTSPDIPCPTLGFLLHSADGRIVSSAASWLDKVALQRSVTGALRAELSFDALPLLKGHYTVSAYVLCERGINVYAWVEHAAAFDVVQEDVHQGIVALPHRWRQVMEP